MTEKKSEKKEQDIRLEKLQAITDAKINPYPRRAKRSHQIGHLLDEFDKIKEDENLIIVGRLVSWRLHGGSTFGHLEDGSGKIQFFIKKDIIGEKDYRFFTKVIDVGDFVQISGQRFITKKGEKTVLVKSLKILTKTLLPLPEKWHGLVDKEIRFRKRYLDLISNKKVKERFIIRSKAVRAIREFLDQEQFIEVETPILQPIPGGANAKPFVTHHNALDIDLYLRIAPELYLKRLIVGGLEKVYEISRCFRNEGIDYMHNPEFTQVEFYWSYADYDEMMELSEKMLNKVVKDSIGKTEVVSGNKKIDFKTPFARIKFRDALLKYANIDIDMIKSLADLAKQAKRLGLEVEKSFGVGKIYDEIYKEKVRDNLVQPTFLIDYPVELSPLAKRKTENPRYAERFQLIAGGMELINAFTELNDPFEQEARFKEQEKLRKAGDLEAQRIDKDFIEALKHGMPPCAGLGMGIDRLVALLTDSHNIKEVILFPTLKPKR
ncbi:MAG: lysine--tRNA ligase [Patescibacteria group bacterium]